MTKAVVSYTLPGRFFFNISGDPAMSRRRTLAIRNPRRCIFFRQTGNTRDFFFIFIKLQNDLEGRRKSTYPATSIKTSYRLLFLPLPRANGSK